MRTRSSSSVPFRLLALVLSALGGSALAHDLDPLWDERLTVSAGFGLMSLHAGQRYPSPRLPGVLEAGSARADEIRDGLDYAEAALRVKLADSLRGYLKLAHHGGPDSRNETEEAWLDARNPLDHDLMTLRAGRQLVPLGLLNPVHAHAQDFGIAPLALRGMINESWRADGLNLTWLHHNGAYAGAGAWRNQGFPGADAGGLQLYTARAGWKAEQFQLEGGHAHVNVDGRALLTLGSSGHTHSVPSCTRISSDRVCLDGTAQLLTLAARWTPADSPFRAAAEWWFKREEGRLDSINGTPAYTGRLNGGWIDLGWRPAAGWDALLRAERLVARHDLNGANATLVASQAGISDSGRALSSLGAVLQWRPAAGHRLAAEWHRERSEPTANTVYLLRYQFNFSQGLL